MNGSQQNMQVGRRQTELAQLRLALRKVSGLLKDVGCLYQLCLAECPAHDLQPHRQRLPL